MERDNDQSHERTLRRRSAGASVEFILRLKRGRSWYAARQLVAAVLQVIYGKGKPEAQSFAHTGLPDRGTGYGRISI